MKQIKIYTTNSCVYCLMAKTLLKQKGLEYQEIDLSNDLSLREELSEKYKWRSVPMILIDDKFIGGYDDLNKIKDQL
ncbi:glutathione S-transferase N-terminal domain-containing protein [Candidatus Peregrinibacteria bacterium]|nr:glutathione S-transferase N-terminal domain-containing protein [Candidatus Peregrinibacteria bacterium]